MADPTFDAKTRVAARTSNYSGTHTPVGTPAGVLITIILDSETTNLITTVTYGGVTVPLAVTLLGTGGSEIGSCFAYFLGDGIPTGAQTVVINYTGLNNFSADIITLTDANGATAVDSSNTINQASGANPSITLATTASTTCFVVGVLHNGRAVVGDTTVGTDFTLVDQEDYGSTCGNTERRTTNSSGGNVTVNWTMPTDEGHALAIGIKSSTPAATGQPMRKRWGGVKHGRVDSQKSKLRSW